ncbi:MAG: hypothetical protein CMB42_04475 [Euryarchaeota archaeon]|nr:hypothetical protein [Euryarchaeota archaeon]|tara:strand:+ start:3342 stop:4073 length:732 start_codon:yes stop_codon:yes gene_type:complete
MQATDDMIVLGLIGGLFLTCIVTRALDFGGLLAAILIGSIIGFYGHWTWLILLLFFLISASVATRWKYDIKKESGFAEDNEGSRGWRNVLANGGAPAIAAILHHTMGEPGWGAISFSCSVAVALSDTLASEIGVLDGRTRSIVSLRVVPTGSNGGMSPTGMLGSALGSSLIAVTAIGLMPSILPSDKIAYILIISAIGWLGCQVDSVLGETLENTGYLGKHSVNFLATSFGAVAGFVSYQLLL